MSNRGRFSSRELIVAFLAAIGGIGGLYYLLFELNGTVGALDEKINSLYSKEEGVKLSADIEKIKKAFSVLAQDLNLSPERYEKLLAREVPSREETEAIAGHRQEEGEIIIFMPAFAKVVPKSKEEQEAENEVNAAKDSLGRGKLLLGMVLKKYPHFEGLEWAEYAELQLLEAEGELAKAEDLMTKQDFLKAKDRSILVKKDVEKTIDLIWEEVASVSRPPG